AQRDAAILTPAGNQLGAGLRIIGLQTLQLRRLIQTDHRPHECQIALQIWVRLRVNAEGAQGVARPGIDRTAIGAGGAGLWLFARQKDHACETAVRLVEDALGADEEEESVARQSRPGRRPSSAARSVRRTCRRIDAAAQPGEAPVVPPS